MDPLIMNSGSFMYAGADIPAIPLPFYGTGEQEVFQKGFSPSPKQKVFPKPGTFSWAVIFLL
jgi:hypothetical protein